MHLVSNNGKFSTDSITIALLHREASYSNSSTRQKREHILVKLLRSQSSSK